MWGGTDKGSVTGLKRLAALAAGLAVLVLAPAALAHVERASYFPDPGVDMADGVPTGGAVPEARDLFTALDETAVSQAFVVCQTGQALEPPEPPVQRQGQQVNGRPDQQVNRDQVDRLVRKLQSLRRKLKDGEGDKGKIKKKVRRVKKRLAEALAAYDSAVLAEELARNQGSIDYQRALAEELAARQEADEQYQQELAQYLDDLDEYEEDVDNDPSIEALEDSMDNARTSGYVIRPSEGLETDFSGADETKLRDFNVRLLAECEYDEIQDAVNDAGNNDRVVVMPGVYTEPTARSKPTHDPACDGMQEQNDRGDTGALSYRWQFHCPNDQNLIAVMGRAPKADPNGPNGEFVPPPPSPTDPRRDGIPDEGPCIRCNLQLEGSGVSADDVVVDAGDTSVGDGQQPGGPEDAAKDVALRVDRADGFVLRNMKFRHSREHDIYSPETDGVLLERFKTRFNGEYGVLTFVADHHLIQDCDAMGSGDAAIYPGSSAEYGEQTDPDYGDPAKEPSDASIPHTISSEFSTEIRRCDMRHSSTGYSGTAANSVWLHHNDFYDNSMGFVTDVFTAAGHPGFPQDSDLVEDNEFYSNNFNVFLDECDPGVSPGPHGASQNCSDVPPRIPAPVGTGMFLPGVNNNTIRRNHFWNNWRRGTMLFSVPDQFVCGPANGDNEQHGCEENPVLRPIPATSHRNEHYENVMGRSPDHAPDPTWPATGQNAIDRNGLDFWWDEYNNNVRNCWYDNSGPNADGTGLTSDPAAPLLPGDGLVDCANSRGTLVPPAPTAPAKEAELLSCLADFEFGTGGCTWFTTPTEP